MILSEIQKQNYFNLCGEPCLLTELNGRFFTSKPYNNEFYKFSPWQFTYLFDSEKGYLICELSHEIAKNRLYGWDHNGNELSGEILINYFNRNTDAFNSNDGNRLVS
ncbi:hypothetical protein BZG02_05280 [Labilibaculum filiforme]|uniref:Uncharacterized protein n=1 Tax=Labilibaculum filiforme TaxID=1940526 RepID=A0A2N3I1Q0_9BACT|nr:hypothetical protein [Labilibaculum filiforme]PKQ64235.1 hypothetical protein BZG02_05280 [Labilibaculum filiforme]